MENINITVQEEDEGNRLDILVSENVSDMSRSAIQKLIKNNDLTVNGKIEKSSYTVKLGDEISLTIPEAALSNIVAENIPIEIVYQDDDIAIINKAKGMVVHPAPGNYSGTLVNALLYHLDGTLSGINGIIRPGIVHRIDKDTTGLLVIAKNDKAHSFLADQFKEHSITREYSFICFGTPKEDEYTVDEAIGRNPKDRLKMAVVQNGRNAITHFKVKDRFKSYAYMSATLETGRTHQIRVHSAYKGYPIVGDELYTGRKVKINTAGQTLHAGKLGFIHPSTKEYIEFSAKEPENFLKIMNFLREKEI